MQLFAAEASGIDSDKLAPRIAATARRLWLLYVAITLLQTMFLAIGGMGLFDSINHAMATIATGGFSTKNASIAGFDSLYIEMVILVFMWISGLSFTLQFRFFIEGRPTALLRSPEARLYTIITVVVIVLITTNLYLSDIYNAADSLRYSSFQTVAIISTTGFGTADFDMWPDFSRVLLVTLMLIGGCAGSTAGGSKVIRLYVIAKHAMVQLRRLVRPRLVQTIAIGTREVPRETTEAILGYYLLYFAAILVLGLAMTALGLDMVSGTTAAISAMNSIGPGLGTVGALQNFGAVPDVGLYLLSFGMLLGRLEIYPLLVLLTAYFWRRG
jgi:trk system potassium uptake protein TrkH